MWKIWCWQLLTLFSVLLGADQSQTKEEKEEQQLWEIHVKERRQREEQRQNERQEALDRERRELEKLEQERVMCHLNPCTSFSSGHLQQVPWAQGCEPVCCEVREAAGNLKGIPSPLLALLALQASWFWKDSHTYPHLLCNFPLYMHSNRTS